MEKLTLEDLTEERAEEDSAEETSIEESSMQEEANPAESTENKDMESQDSTSDEIINEDNEEVVNNGMIKDELAEDEMIDKEKMIEDEVIDKVIDGEAVSDKIIELGEETQNETQENKYRLRQIFIEEFVGELIINSKPGTGMEIRKIMPATPMPATRASAIRQLSKPAQVLTAIAKGSPTKALITIPQTKTISKQVSPDSGIIKINRLMADPAVLNIKCNGANKPLLVNRSGVMQRTNIALSAVEIKKIIDNFSQRARIPIEGNTLRLAVGNLIVTAMLPEFVNTGFTIQKRSPLQPLQFLQKQAKTA